MLGAAAAASLGDIGGSLGVKGGTLGGGTGVLLLPTFLWLPPFVVARPRDVGDFPSFGLGLLALGDDGAGVTAFTAFFITLFMTAFIDVAGVFTGDAGSLKIDFFIDFAAGDLLLLAGVTVAGAANFMALLGTGEAPLLLLVALFIFWRTSDSSFQFFAF